MPVRSLHLGALLVLAAMHATAAAQTAGPDLAKAKNCMACHGVDNKLVGPSYKSVAERYASDPEAAGKLAQSIRKGSVRKWGAIPMPAQNAVNDDEARQLAEWVLSLKP
ncbi:MAG: c-type cytochrome [Pigmentiphaga sp.]|uniref:c-type cytochrome n=1 Tax=Pigmentiphaga sp. TaxID=1977564 RepID=UPI0029B32E1B|nr:c-type cytochrome [Pigmentiphaga sp.]MDX3906547.1 c-type cytochrome [Pigmentiphaga sp.]